jgi:hypothetical protein
VRTEETKRVPQLYDLLTVCIILENEMKNAAGKKKQQQGKEI